MGVNPKVMRTDLWNAPYQSGSRRDSVLGTPLTKLYQDPIAKLAKPERVHRPRQVQQPHQCSLRLPTGLNRNCAVRLKEPDVHSLKFHKTCRVQQCLPLRGLGQ